MNKDYDNIKNFMSSRLGHIKPSKKLSKSLRDFRLEWSTKSDVYMDFLGSNLFGVHKIRFSPIDDNKLMEDVLKINRWDKLQQEIYDVDGIDKDFKTVPNFIYQTLVYIGMLYMTDTNLSDKDRKEGLRNVCLILQYKMVTSIYSHFFKYLVPINIATTVYDKLSHKFLIKQLDSWQDVFEYRVDKCNEPGDTNHVRFKTYKTEDACIIISDIWTKLKTQMIYLYRVLVEVTENNESLVQESMSYIGGEHGEEQIVEKTGGLTKYISNIKDIATSPNDFVHNDIVKIVSSLYTNIDDKQIFEMLNHMSNGDNFTNSDILPSVLVEEILLISFKYLQRLNINVEDRSSIPDALVSIRFFWSGSKVKNENMIRIKKHLAKEAGLATGRKTSWLLAGLSLVYINYIFLRSLK